MSDKYHELAHEQQNARRALESTIKAVIMEFEAQWLLKVTSVEVHRIKIHALSNKETDNLCGVSVDVMVR